MGIYTQNNDGCQNIDINLFKLKRYKIITYFDFFIICSILDNYIHHDLDIESSKYFKTIDKLKTIGIIKEGNNKNLIYDIDRVNLLIELREKKEFNTRFDKTKIDELLNDD